MGERRDSRGVEPKKVALACSGGADSTFLAREVAEGRMLAESPQVWVVDHGHRADSAFDAAAAVQLYLDLGLPARVLGADSVAADENSLRNARYAALQEAALADGVGTIWTAHTADDVAETVLLRIFRGTGLRGLAGIPARRELTPGVWVERPILHLRRVAMRQALVDAGQAWIEDPTNADPAAAARNRLRHEVLPALATISTGDPVKAVLRLAAEAGEWNECLQSLMRASGKWQDFPSYLRRQVLAQKLRDIGETVSPARLKDLEGALMSKGSAKPTADLRWSRNTLLSEN